MRLFSSIAAESRSSVAVPQPTQIHIPTRFSLNPLDVVDLVPVNILGAVALPTRAALRLASFFAISAAAGVGNRYGTGVSANSKGEDNKRP